MIKKISLIIGLVGILILSFFLFRYFTFDPVTYFTDIAEPRIVDELGGHPIHGFEPEMYLMVFPGLTVTDFENVEASQGVYDEINGQLILEEREEQLHSAAYAIINSGIATLLSNVAIRLGVGVSTRTEINTLIPLLEKSSN